MISILSTAIFVITLTQMYSHAEPPVLKSLENDANFRVTGILITFCGSPVLYSPVFPPVPLSEAANYSQLHFSKLLTDWTTECLNSRAEMVAYCHRMFSNTSDSITDVTLAPTAVPVNLSTENTVQKGREMLLKENMIALRPYWCLIGKQASIGQARSHQQPLPPPTHNLPTVFDIHRAFFLKRFDQLSNRTDKAISSLVNRVIHAVEQLTSLPAVTPQQVLLLTSNLLQAAHQRMQLVWTSDEAEWSRLENQRHVTVATELNSEDLAGEHEFAYVLQEPGATIDRLQTALSRLLVDLADSVHEEVYHLEAVLKRQPKTLRLKVYQTDVELQGPYRVPAYITSLSKVHGALLKFVQQATVAINIFRERMRKDRPKDAASPSTPHHHRYRPELVANYNRLQDELQQARRVLSLAKRRVLSDLTKDSQSLADKLKATATEPKNSSFSGLSDPLGVLHKHRDDLAYLDFMVGHVLNSYPHKPANFSDDQLLTWSRIWRPGLEDLTVVRPPDPTDSRKNFAMNFMFGFLLTFKAIALLLCISLVILLVGMTVYFTRQNCRVSRSSGQLLAELQHVAKHWLASLLGPSSKMGDRRRFERSLSIAENRPMTMESASGLRPLDNVHGYSNPACDNFKVVAVANT